ncbi:YozE family protein [Bacillus sp. PS06]|uniref:YozE family protein n=1 Tax=Bacillus sp. PS06 TaxID=2764176 RepID=UPI00178666FB|nr:YozE family protein [Bacillus sp. PS06]MBD8068037.1 YozE family protein [Bacillus sp. PS06]
MRKSFYHYMLKYRNEKGKDELSLFANNMYLDHSFPKNIFDYHEISTYLEFNGEYLDSMSVFDRAWELYISDEE